MTLGSLAQRKRKAYGMLNTYCRIGTRGSSASTRGAALSAMRQARQLGKKPRRLQLKATSLAWVRSAVLAACRTSRSGRDVLYNLVK